MLASACCAPNGGRTCLIQVWNPWQRRLQGIPELVVEGKTGFRFESGQLDDLANHLLQASALNGDEYAVMQQECGDYINRRAQQSLYIRSLGELYMRCLQIPTQQRDVEEEK